MKLPGRAPKPEPEPEPTPREEGTFCTASGCGLQILRGDARWARGYPYCSWEHADADAPRESTTEDN